MFYNVQTINFTFVGGNMRYTVHRYSIAGFQIISDTKYQISVLHLSPPSINHAMAPFMHTLVVTRETCVLALCTMKYTILSWTRLQTIQCF